MGTGYTRNDTPNNIADGNVINASDLDGEFDAIQAAFNATTGHSHDGTTGEGPQIDTGGIADDAVTGAKIDSTTTITAAGFSGPLTGTASNAALLDSLDSTQFLRSDAADTKTSGDLSFSDNVKAVFGSGSDLEIYHDSNNSFINDVGTGNLRIGADTNVSITNSTNSTNYAVFNDASAVKLYYGGVKKFETTSSGITVEGSTAPTINIKSTDTVVVANDVVGAITFEESDATGGTGVQAFIKAIANDSGSTYDMSIGVGGNTEAIRIDQSGFVGIGTSSPLRKLHVSNSGAEGFEFGPGNTSNQNQILHYNRSTSSYIENNNRAGSHTWDIASSEAARIDSSGRFLVGKTAYGSVSTDGTTIDPSFFQTSASNDRPMLVNRNGTDGNLIEFSKSGAAAGSIGTVAGDVYIANAVDVGLYLESSGTDHIAPCNISGAKRDAAIDLGSSSARFRNSYFSGQVFATSFTGESDTDTAIQMTGSDIMKFYTGGFEAARIDSSQNLLVGKSASDRTVAGGEILSSGGGRFTRDGADPLYLNRLTNDGTLISLRRNDSAVGDIGVDSGDNLYLTGQTGNTGGIYMNDAAVSPAYQGAERDAYYDLGKGAARWKDLHLSGQANVGTAVAATQSASVTGSTTLDFSTYQNFILTMTGNITLAQPSTEQAGQSGFIIFIHSGAARTVSLGADYETAGAAGLTLSGASGAVDLVPYVVQSSGNILLGAPQLAFA